VQADAFGFLGVPVRRLDFPPTGWTRSLALHGFLPSSLQERREDTDGHSSNALTLAGRGNRRHRRARPGAGAEFRRRGATVAFVARGGERVQLVARETPGTVGIVGDVARKEDVHRIASQVVGALGGLDVLVNNASNLGPMPLQLLADTECEQLKLALATNLVGPFRLTRALLGALSGTARDGRGAVILNVISDAAINPYPQWGAYGASKAALLHLSRIWEAELAGRRGDTSARA
jgi:NAD(P)-dependent dehydrogenase (short-subunit alcohol dehydrogenase family)